jgi:hypothetical protein
MDAVKPPVELHTGTGASPELPISREDIGLMRELAEDRDAVESEDAQVEALLAESG